MDTKKSLRIIVPIIIVLLIIGTWFLKQSRKVEIKEMNLENRTAFSESVELSEENTNNSEKRSRRNLSLEVMN